jgi:hypothetical protein
MVDDLMTDAALRDGIGVPDRWRWLAGLENDDRVEQLTRDLMQRVVSYDEFREALDDAQTERWAAQWQVARESGAWLAAQRWLVSQALNYWIESHGAEPHTTWDDAGRRIEYMAYGVREIVGAHMASIFAAPMPGVYLCSVCDRPFELDDTARRRPREGARRYCGEACRLNARRESNRAAWHRHKDQWRRVK